MASECGQVEEGQIAVREAIEPRWAGGRAMLSVPEVAAACGVSAKTVQRWIAYEGLPTILVRAAGARSMVFVRPTDLEAWILQHRHDPKAMKDHGDLRINGRRFVSSPAKKPARRT